MNMKTKLIIAGTGNFIDAIATYILTQYYGFTELNPFMAWLLQWPELAIAFKMIVVSSVLIYTWRSERTKYSDFLATFMAVVYGGIGIYYIIMFLLMV